MEDDKNETPALAAESLGPAATPSRAEIELMIAERDARWQAQLDEFRRALQPQDAAEHAAAEPQNRPPTHSAVPAVQLREQLTEQQLKEQQADGQAETPAERLAREHKAAQRTRAAAQTRQAVDEFGTTGTLPVSGSAAPHNPIAHIIEPVDLYRLARHDFEQAHKNR